MNITIEGVEYTPVKTESMPYCMVRTYSAGVFAGYIKEQNGQEGTLIKARRIWQWSGAASLSQLAMEGTSNPSSCKFPCVVDEVILTQIIEIIPITEKAKKSIESVPIWKM
jgi:hypothetical protein